MAVAKHVDHLNKGVEFWNAWRRENHKVRPVLTGANLKDRDFTGINFLKANLSAADLTGAILRSANLRYTDFSGSTLCGVDFLGATIMLADLTGADLSDAVGLTNDQIDECITDDATILPDSFRGPVSK